MAEKMTELKVLLFGSSGVLGSAFLEELNKRKITVIAPSRAHFRTKHRSSLSLYIQTINPNLVINCLSMNGITHCFLDGHAALDVNAYFPISLARICDTCSIKLIHFSTECVFDNSDILIEDSVVPAFPVTTYGASKLLGELPNHHNFHTIRLPLLLSHKPNSQIVWKIASRLSNGLPASSSRDVISSPVFVEDVANRLLSIWLASEKIPNLVHISSDTRLSLYDTLLKFCLNRGISTASLESSLDDDYPSPEKKPLALGLKASSKDYLLPW